MVNADDLNITYHIGKIPRFFHGGTYPAGKTPRDFHGGTYHVGKTPRVFHSGTYHVGKNSRVFDRVICNVDKISPQLVGWFRDSKPPHYAGNALITFARKVLFRPQVKAAPSIKEHRYLHKFHIGVEAIKNTVGAYCIRPTSKVYMV